jgi:hypothetical protein
MAISYSENNKREHIFEPILNRQRLIYKGPVLSSVLNLVNDQILMDINRLAKKLEHLQILIDNSTDMSRNDLNLATPDYYLNEDLLMTIYSQYVSYDKTTKEYNVEASTPYYNDSLEFNKPQLNSSFISHMLRKLDLIEAKLRGEN